MANYTGYLLNSKSHQIQGYFVVTTPAGPGPVQQTSGNGFFSVDLGDSDTVRFSANGYKSQTFRASDFLQGERSDVSLADGFRVKPWMYVAVVAAILLLRSGGKRKVGKFDSGDVKTIFYIVGGIIALSTITRILRSLGLAPDPDDIAIEAESSSASSPWNPTYWQTIKPAGASWSFAYTESQAGELAKQIYNAVGFFSDDEAGVSSVIRQMRTRANLSFLAWVFAKKYNLDLLQFLKDGKSNFWWNGLSSEDLVQLNSFIYGLPKY